jgi:hypothetical protein
VGIAFALEKNLFFTGFAHPKPGLWKSCELDLWRSIAPEADLWRETPSMVSRQVLKNLCLLHWQVCYCSARLSERRPGWASALGCLGIAIVPVLAMLLMP